MRVRVPVKLLSVLMGLPNPSIVVVVTSEPDGHDASVPRCVAIVETRKGGVGLVIVVYVVLKEQLPPAGVFNVGRDRSSYSNEVVRPACVSDATVPSALITRLMLYSGVAIVLTTPPV